MQLQRREVFFSGRVQGVGFRYTTMRLAASYAVTGFVRNLADGRVHLVIEGPPPETEGLVAQVKRTMADNIANVESTTSDYTGSFDDFHIQR